MRINYLFVSPGVLAHVLLVDSDDLENLLNSSDFLLLRFVGETSVVEGAASPLQAVEVLLYPFNVLQTQFGLDGGHVPTRIDIAINVGDFGVVERADQLEDAIDGTDVGKESVAEASTGGRASC